MWLQVTQPGNEANLLLCIDAHPVQMKTLFLRCIVRFGMEGVKTIDFHNQTNKDMLMWRRIYDAEVIPPGSQSEE